MGRAPRAGRAAAELAALRDALAAEASAAAERVARMHRADAAAAQARQLFREAVRDVTPLAASGRAELVRPLPPPLPRQREADEQAALREAWSDAVDVETLLLTDEGLSFRRPGVGADVVARLRRGHWAIQAELDLHGMTRDAARAALAAFVREAARQGRRCLRVVHGKGRGSPGGQPVLKSTVPRWLAQSAPVIAFAQARASDGGAGALLVLLGAQR